MEEVKELLAKHRLEKYFEHLKILGVESTQDLEDVDADDLTTMGMTKIQRNRFCKMMNPSHPSFLSGMSSSCSDLDDSNSVASTRFSLPRSSSSMVSTPAGTPQKVTSPKAPVNTGNGTTHSAMPLLDNGSFPVDNGETAKNRNDIAIGTTKIPPIDKRLSKNASLLRDNGEPLDNSLPADNKPIMANGTPLADNVPMDSEVLVANDIPMDYEVSVDADNGAVEDNTAPGDNATPVDDSQQEAKKMKTCFTDTLGYVESDEDSDEDTTSTVVKETSFDSPLFVGIPGHPKLQSSPAKKRKEDTQSEANEEDAPATKKAKPSVSKDSTFGLKYIVLQQADTCTVWDNLQNLDPETVTLKDIIDQIVQGEGADPKSTTAELYTEEGVPLSNDPYLMTWSLRRRGITSGTLLLAILCQTGLKHCKLLSDNTPSGSSLPDPDIEDRHTLQCQLDSCGDMYEIKLDLEKHRRKDLMYRIEEATGIPSQIQLIRVPSSATLCDILPDWGSLAEQGVWDNDKIVVRPRATPDSEGTGVWENNYTCDVKPLVEQTQRGMQMFASVLYVVAAKELELDVRGGYLMGLIRRLTCWTPLIAALNTLNRRKPLITAEKVAIVEGLYFLFRKILQTTDAAGSSSSPGGISDDHVFEYAPECWAYLMKTFEHRDAASETYKEIPMTCPQTNKHLVQPVRVAPNSSVYEKDEVFKCIKEGTKLTGHPKLLTEADIIPAVDIQMLLFVNADKAKAKIWDKTSGPMLPGSRPETLHSRSVAELKAMHQDFPILQIWPPLQIKSHSIDAPCMTLNKQQMPVVFGGYCKSIDSPANLYNPWDKRTEMESFDELAACLEDVEFAAVTSEMLNGSRLTRPPMEAIMVVLDTSFSMSFDCFSSSMTRIDAVKELFYAFADRSMAYNFPHLIGLITFSTDVVERGKCSELFEKFKGVLEPIVPGCKTALYDAIWTAGVKLKELRKKFPDCRRRILCLTDGDDNASNATSLETVQFLQEEEIVLDAVQIGSCSASDLKSCAYASGGYCFKPRNLPEGRKIFEMETVLSIRTRKQSKPPRRRVRSWNGLNVYSIKTYATKVDHCTPVEIKKPAAHAYAVLDKAAKDKTPPALKSVDRTKRILRELSALARDPHPAFSVYPSEDNIGFWRLLLVGPVDTPYAGGVFSLYIEFPDNYPMGPPQIRFLTPVYHCNINTIGRICHSVFDRNYTSDVSVKTILSCVYGLLMTPEPKDPLDGVLAEEYFTSKAAYTAKAVEWTAKHASKTLEQCEKTLIVGSTLQCRPLPSTLICPLTKQLFVDPVQTPSCHVYERHAIENHLSKICSDPRSLEPLVSADLESAVTIKRQAAEFRANQAKVSAWWQSS